VEWIDADAPGRRRSAPYTRRVHADRCERRILDPHAYRGANLGFVTTVAVSTAFAGPATGADPFAFAPAVAL
jgi:hypothetical protein